MEIVYKTLGELTPYENNPRNNDEAEKRREKEQDWNMANEDNLIPVRTTDEARERGRNGGIASGEARRRKKSIKETLDILLECKPTDKDLALMRAQGVDVDNDATYRQAIAFSIVNRAMKGNTRAFELIRDTVGEMPVQKVAIAEVDDALIDEVEREVLADDEE